MKLQCFREHYSRNNSGGLRKDQIIKLLRVIPSDLHCKIQSITKSKYTYTYVCNIAKLK